MTSDVSPGPLAGFLSALRRMYLRAGEPSTREIARRLSGALSHDTVHRVLTASSLPKWRNVEPIVTVLHGDVDQMRTLWLAARVAEDSSAALPAPVAVPEVRIEKPRVARGAAKILIVDDHPLFRFGLAQLLTGLGYEVREAADGDESVRVAAEFNPALVLMDINMPGMSGIDATAVLHSKHPDARVVMLTMFEDTERVRQSLRAGASGYLVKDAALEDLRSNVARALAGEPVFTSELAKTVMMSYEPAENALPQLSTREREQLRLAAGGITDRKIAVMLGVSTKTVANYWANIKQKLDAATRESAVALAARAGLIDD